MGMNTNAQNPATLSGTSFGTFCSHRGRNADEVGYCLHCDDVCLCKFLKGVNDSGLLCRFVL